MPHNDPITHGPYTIKTVKTGETWQARAFRGDHIASGIHRGSSREEALLAVKAELDAASAAERAARGPDGYPTVDAVEGGLSRIWRHTTPAQQQMLAAHLGAPGCILTATQLAAAAGYADYGLANLHYGKLGRMLAEEMDWHPGTEMWTFALATDANAAPGAEMATGEWKWQLRPEVVEAAGRLGIPMESD
jgi:hypothetical protein